MPQAARRSSWYNRLHCCHSYTYNLQRKVRDLEMESAKLNLKSHIKGQFYYLNITWTQHTNSVHLILLVTHITSRAHITVGKLLILSHIINITGLNTNVYVQKKFHYISTVFLVLDKPKQDEINSIMQTTHSNFAFRFINSTKLSNNFKFPPLCYAKIEVKEQILMK